MTDVRPTASMGWPQRLLVGLGILGALSFILIAGIIIYSFSFNFQPRPRPEIETRAGAETMVIGPIAEVPGTNLTALTIMKTERSGGKLSSYTQEDQRNVILLDRDTAARVDCFRTISTESTAIRFCQHGQRWNPQVTTADRLNAKPMEQQFSTLRHRARPQPPIIC